ncbi:hypothetical protein DL771_004323 [Monosporascus sp. 5C6A]|nr:hypothetical protein DL771_004323 [Monosporascus sp. 5C6A]
MPRVIPMDNVVWRHIRNGDGERIKRLFAEQKASPYDVDTDGTSVLHAAVGNWQIDTCRFLQSSGADWNHVDANGIAAVHEAWRSILSRDPQDPSVPRLKALLQTDENQDAMNLTALHMSALGLSSLSLEQQLESNPGALNVPDSYGKTTLCWAASRDDLAAVQMLLKWGAQPDLGDRTGRNALHHAVLASSLGSGRNALQHSVLARSLGVVSSLDVVRSLLDSGASVDAADIWGDTALALASRRLGSPDQNAIIELLLDRGARIDSRNDTGSTPLHVAASEAPPETVSFLLLHGADIDTQDSELKTPIMVAVEVDEADNVRVLQECGANLSGVCKKGWNLLAYAAAYASIPTMEVLRESKLRNIDVDARDVSGRTVWDIFEQLRNDLCVRQRAPLEQERAALEALLSSVGQTGDAVIDIHCIMESKEHQPMDSFWQCSDEESEMFEDAIEAL